MAQEVLKRGKVSQRIATLAALKICENYTKEIVKFLDCVKKLR